MKRINIKIAGLLGIASMFLISCENKTDITPSTATFFPKIEIVGDESINLPCNEVSYNDEGVIISEGGIEVNTDVNTTITGKYFGSNAVNGPDEYQISYAALNADGIPGSAVRSVFWAECNGDLVNSIAGVYTSSPLRTDPFDDRFVGVASKVIIKDLGNNQYQISDGIGGYYEYGRALGGDFAVTGLVVTANDIASNNFEYGDFVLYGSPFGLGDAQMSIVGLTVDPVAKTIIMNSSWDLYADGSAIFTWESVLTQD